MLLRLSAVILLIALLAGAAPESSPEEVVRQGNAAFEREEFAAALALYERAEERITNPGLVAHNKAAALFRLGRFDEAARHYESALEDASGPRRAALLYDLGNCRLHQSQGASPERLKNAVECFARCLSQDGIDTQLRDDAQHNLELAKLLWLKARQSGNNNETGNQPEPKEPPKTEDKPPKEQPKNSGNDSGTEPRADPMTGAAAETDPRHGQQSPIPTKEPPPPGKSNLPPIPDKAELVPMAPEDAIAHLQRAAAKVLRERRQHQESSAPRPSRVIPDY
jgi:tetratricopeptide (TPR) repeat protein